MAEGNELDQLAAHADKVKADTPDTLAPDLHAQALRDLQLIYEHSFVQAAHHFNTAREVLDAALHRHNNPG